MIKTLKLIIRKFKRILFRNSSFSAPKLKDRTWPDREILIKENIALQSEIHSIFKNSELKKVLNKLNWQKLEKETNQWLLNKNGGASFLIALLSIHKLFTLSK